MLAKLFKRLGYQGIDDAVEFLVCGIAILPVLLMLNGFMLGGAASLFGLLLLLAVVGMSSPVPPAANDKPDKKTPN